MPAFPSVGLQFRYTGVCVVALVIGSRAAAASPAPTLGHLVLEWWIVSLIVGAILVAAFLLGYTFRRKQTRLYKELLRLEQERHTAEQELGATLYSIPDAVITSDIACRVRRMNPTAERMTGWTENRARTEPIDRIVVLENDDSSEPIPNPVQELARTGALPTLPSHLRIVARDGLACPVSVSLAPVLDPYGQTMSIVLVLHDRSKERTIELQLERAMEEAERSNRDLEQFAYVASHDLQEPLRMVASYTQLLAQRYGDQLDDKARKYIDYAVDGASRMQVLINDLLTYSRIGTRGGRIEETDSHAALGVALARLATSIMESHAIVTNDDLPVVRADAGQLVQLFQNVVGNSLKYRGEMTPHIHISVEQQGGKWCFSIRDNGIGFDMKFADRIFVIFQRLHTRQEFPGTGIGLAICQRIIERHGGTLWAESAPAQGATFYFTLPKLEEKFP